MGLFDRFKKTQKESLLKYLQYKISDKSSLENIVDVLYVSTAENKNFEQNIWNEDIEENIFSYIKKTSEFSFCKNKEFSKVEIYLDET